MLDRHLRPLIDPPLSRLGVGLASVGISANAVTLAGLVLALLAAACIAAGWFLAAAGLILASRLADGLDGAVARATGPGPGPGDFGGLLDIVADFVFYAAVPLGFVLADPSGNGLAGAGLIAAFYVNAATFLGYGILAAKRGLESSVNGPKAWYHSTGLLEGTETIVVFVAFCLWPAAFAPLAWVFAGLCLLTAGLRLLAARAAFGD